MTVGANGRQLRTSQKPSRRAYYGQPLTQREIEVISRLVAPDEPVRRIAAADLQIAEATVQLHLTRIYIKLGVRTRLGMYRKVVEQMGIKLRQW